MQTKIALAAPAAVLAVLVLAGCSASSTGSTTSSAPPSNAPTTATQSATPASSAASTSAAASSAAASSTSASSTLAAGSTSPATATGACTNGQLAISAAGLGGAAGHGGYALRFHNVSSRTCTLRGYPGLDALRSAKPPVHAKRTVQGYMGGSQHGVPTVRLLAGRTASAVVEYSNIEGAAGNACPTAPHIAVTAANTTRSVTLADPVTICSLQIHPTVPGSSGDDS